MLKHGQRRDPEPKTGSGDALALSRRSTPTLPETMMSSSKTEPPPHRPGRKACVIMRLISS